MDYITCMIIVFTLVFIFHIKNYIRAVYLALNLFGPPALPILGNVLLLNNTKELEIIGTNAHQLYGPFIRTWISVIPFFFINEPRHLKIILTGKNSKKNFIYTLLHNFVGRGLITNNGNKWKFHRKLIQPYFHINILENYISIFSQSAVELVKKLEGHEDVKITPFINHCILSILHRAVLGVRFENEKDSPFRKGELLLVKRLTNPWLLLETVFKYSPIAKYEEIQKLSLYNYTKKILERRKLDTKKEEPCLLDMFLEISENNKDFTDDDIINEAVTFMLAGQDSVGAAVAFTLHYIAKHQDVQSKILQELNEDVPENDQSVRTSIHSLKYLEQCIKESLRLAPSVPIMCRILTEDVILDGYTFPSGTNIFISPFITHRLPHHFPDPLKFDPDRFSQGNVEKLHPFAFIPFSMGYRNCIGYKFALLEIKTVLAAILKRFQISPAPGHEDLQLSYRTTLRAVGGVWLRLHCRK